MTIAIRSVPVWFQFHTGSFLVPVAHFSEVGEFDEGYGTFVSVLDGRPYNPFKYKYRHSRCGKGRG